MSDDPLKQQAERVERFRSTLNHRRQLIVDQWGELRAGRWTPAGVDMLRNWVHQLANGSTQCGYAALGEYARELEHRLTAVLPDQQPSRDAMGGLVASVSRLKLQLDRVIAMELTEHPPAARQELPSGSVSPLIDVVTTDTELQQFLDALLRSQGYRVRSFADPALLLPTLASAPPEAMLISASLGQGDWQGVKLLETIQAHSRKPLPILVLATEVDIALRLKALKAGAAACIAQPIDAVAVMSSLQTACLGAARPGLRVLIVSDQAGRGRQHADSLAAAGFRVVGICPPVQVLSQLGEGKPDVLLIDLEQPECSADELVTLLADVPEYETLPALCLAADADRKTRKHAHELGIHRFLGHSASTRELTEQLRLCVVENQRWLARVGQARQGMLDHEQLDRYAFAARLGALLASTDDSSKRPALLYLALDQAIDVLERDGLPELLIVHRSLASTVAAALADGDAWCELGTGVFSIALVARPSDQQREFLASLKRAIFGLGLQSRDGTRSYTASAALLPLTGQIGHANNALERAQQATRSSRSAGGNRFLMIDLPASRAAGPAPAGTVLPVDRLLLDVRPVTDRHGVAQRLHDALVQLRDEQGVPRSARSLLVQSEAQGLSAQLDLWEMRAAVDHLQRLPGSSPPLELAVRLFEVSLESPMLLPVVRSIVASLPKDHGHSFVLQVDEPWLAVHEAAGMELVATLRDLGCGVMLGNFGATDHPRTVAWASWFDYAKLAPLLPSSLAMKQRPSESLEIMIRSASSRGARIIACDVRGKKSRSALFDWGVRLYL